METRQTRSRRFNPPCQIIISGRSSRVRRSNGHLRDLVGAVKDFFKDGNDQNTIEDVPKISIDLFENPSDIVPKYFCVLLARILFLLMFL